MTHSFPLNEYHHLTRILSELKEIMQRESKRHQMDEHLTPSMSALIEDEIIPMLENELNVDYSDDEVGEPPLTSAEIHHAAWVQKQAMRR